MPEKINRDYQFLHSNNEAAIFYSNQWLYYIYGVKVNKKLLNSLINKSYTFEDFTKESNEEIKSAILNYLEENYGGEYVYRFLSQYLKEIDTFVHKKENKYLEGTTNGENVGVYTLFKGNVNNVNVAYIKCYDYSTDRIFFLDVHESFDKADKAIASLCQILLELQNNLKEIRIQGEVYIFTFDEIGTKLLKDNSININNIVSLTAKEYFDKITWNFKN